MKQTAKIWPLSRDQLRSAEVADWAKTVADFEGFKKAGRASLSSVMAALLDYRKAHDPFARKTDPFLFSAKHDEIEAMAGDILLEAQCLHEQGVQ